MSSARRVTLIRHAKSDHPSGELDVDRTLSHRGRRDAERMVAPLLASAGLPDAILVSSARRAAETVDLLRKHAERGLGHHLAKPIVDPRLYLAEPETIIAVLTEFRSLGGSLWLCGHNPGITDAVLAIAGVDLGNVPTLGACTIQLEEEGPHVATGRLVAYLTPAMLR